MDIDIGIPQDARTELTDGLARLLADTWSLYHVTHGFHWNVTGPMFQTLHLMFMEQYTELWNALDEVAERIRSLGEYAPGTYRELSELTSLSEPDGVPAATDMIRHLVAGHEAVIRTARVLVGKAEEAGDQVTADLATQRLQVHEKTAWMLRSLLA